MMCSFNQDLCFAAFPGATVTVSPFKNGETVTGYLK